MTKLEKFHDWMTGRGRAESTADQYVACLTLCLDGGDVKARLVDPDLSPNAKRINKAALRAWARWTKNHKLLAELDDLKLPPAERVTIKEPLDDDEWADLVAAIEGSGRLSEPVRAALLMIAERGFRVGDVVRLSRRAVRVAIDTGVLNFKAKGGRQLAYGAEPFEHHLQVFVDEGKQNGIRWSTVADLISPRAVNTQNAARHMLQRWMPEIASDAGLDPSTVYPHRLRRTYATAFLEAVDGDLVKLRDHLQWSDINTAARYADHSRRAELDEIAAKMRKKRKKKKR